MLSLWVQILEWLSNRRLSIKGIGIAPVSRNLGHMVSQLLQGIVKVMDSFLFPCYVCCVWESTIPLGFGPCSAERRHHSPGQSTCFLRLLLHLAQDEEFGKQRSPI